MLVVFSVVFWFGGFFCFGLGFFGNSNPTARSC